jgi:SNF family Na+-dependent transporter
MFGQDFFSTISESPDMLLTLGSLAMAIFAGWHMDEEVVRSEFCQGTKWTWLYAPWRFSLRWLVPAAILLILTYQNDGEWMNWVTNYF